MLEGFTLLCMGLLGECLHGEVTCWWVTWM